MKANTEKTEIALKKVTAELATLFSTAEKEVAAIEEQYLNIVPTADSKEDYDFCKRVRKEVQPMKVNVERIRKELKAPFIDAGRNIDSHLNPLVKRLEAVYKPFVSAYQEKDNEAKRIEEARQKSVQDAFDNMNQVLVDSIGKSPTVIEAMIDDFADFSVDPKIFQDREQEALNRFHEIMEKLTQSLMAAKQAEKREEEEEAFKAKLADLERRENEMKAKQQEQRREDERRLDAERKRQQADSGLKNVEQQTAPKNYPIAFVDGFKKAVIFMHPDYDADSIFEDYQESQK